MTNDQVITQGVNKAREIIDRRIFSALEYTAMSLETLRPFGIKWTGNLLDSIGCGIYKDGTLRKFYIPQRIATDPRSGDDEFPIDSRQVEDSEIPLWNVPNGVDVDAAWWGEDALFNMIKDPPMEIQTMTGWALYYVAAMPYASIVDYEHAGVVLKEGAAVRLFYNTIKKG